MSSDVAVELHSLRKASKQILPAAMDVYDAVNQALAATFEGDDDAFGGTYGPLLPVGELWREMRDAMSTHLAGTAVALSDTAAGLDQVVLAYVGTDNAIREELIGLARRDQLPLP